MAPIRCAVVGLRQGMENVNVLLRHPRFQLDAVCDLNFTYYEWMTGARRIEDDFDDDAVRSGLTYHAPFARGHPRVGEVRFEGDFDRLIADPELDAVFIYVPDPAHAALTLSALEAGKYVLLTKPLAASISDGRRITEAAQAHPGHFMLGFHMSYSPFADIVLDRIRSGRLGSVRHLYSEHHRGPLHAPHHLKNTPLDGPILKEGCHWLDLLHLFAGRPRFVQVSGSGGLDVQGAVQEIDDNGVAIIEFENGVRAFHGYTYFGSAEDRSSFALIGDRGILRGDLNRLILESEGGEEAIEVVGMGVHSGYGQMHDRFADLVLEGRPSLNDAEVALENLLLSSAAQRAVIERRTVTRQEMEASAAV